MKWPLNIHYQKDCRASEHAFKKKRMAESEELQEWKVCEVVKEINTQFTSIHTRPASSRWFISKTGAAAAAAAAQGTEAGEAAGCPRGDARPPLKTPGWCRSGGPSRVGKPRLPGGCCGWSTCRTGSQRTASSWTPGGETPKLAPPPPDILPLPHWRSRGIHPKTWKKASRQNDSRDAKVSERLTQINSRGKFRVFSRSIIQSTWLSMIKSTDPSRMSGMSGKLGAVFF